MSCVGFFFIFFLYFKKLFYAKYKKNIKRGGFVIQNRFENGLPFSDYHKTKKQPHSPPFLSNGVCKSSTVSNVYLLKWLDSFQLIDKVSNRF